MGVIILIYLLISDYFAHIFPKDDLPRNFRLFLWENVPPQGKYRHLKTSFYISFPSDYISQSIFDIPYFNKLYGKLYI